MVALHLTGLIVGAVVGALAAVLLSVAIAWAVRHSASMFATLLYRKTRIPATFFLVVIGAWGGFLLSISETPNTLDDHVSHGLLIAAIALAGWAVYSGLGLMGDDRLLSDVTTGRDIRRFKTQMEILRRVGQSTTVILTLVFILLTFPEARAPMASILASAGLVSVVAGLAAQSSLGNMFAGLQLAFTDAIRVGDNVVVPGETQPGRVEEVTLTYVVVRIWDERRVILPSSEFTTKSFENWTRKSAAQLVGFNIEVDWRAPVAEIRAEVERLLGCTDLWDGRTWSVQVYDLSGPYMTLRIVVSGDNWARLQDLRAFVRENLVDWICKNTPWAMPQQRIIESTGQQNKVEMTTDALDPKLLTDPTFKGPLGGGEMSKDELYKPDPDADIGADPLAPAAAQNVGTGLFHGSPDNDRRAAIYDGPGHETLWQRTLRSLQRDAMEAGLPLHGTFDDEVVARAKQQADGGAVAGGRGGNVEAEGRGSSGPDSAGAGKA